MGAYLSEPVTDKVSSDGESDRVRYGASSMQGWRIHQEDAHNCVPDFDADTSLFAVYDGHGGHEVAHYCAQKLPDFIKGTDAYQDGRLNDALVDAFLGFDSTIATKDVVAVLKELAGDKSKEPKEDECNSDDEDNVYHLYEEASMPIEQVMQKYQANLLNRKLKKLQGDATPVSPFLRARKLCEPSCAGSSREPDQAPEQVVSSSDLAPCVEPVSTTSNGDAKQETPDSSGDAKAAATTAEPSSPDKLNGEISESDKPDVSSSTTPQENGQVSPPSKGKGKAILKKRPLEERSPNKVLPARRARQLYNKLLELDEEESDSEDDNDATFDGGAEHSDSDEEEAEADGCPSSDDDDADEDADEDGDDDDSDDDAADDADEELLAEHDQEPGSDSGCTAVVALLRTGQLYVANAGDSRCVVCRAGRALDMSVDHKPEDEAEMARIQRAGGKVTSEGRVDGGLNLSRALGDHAYKQNRTLPAREQMITALPDVRTLAVDPATDEFMVLACDGIWNFMSSQEVVEFVRPRLLARQPLSAICEQLFDHCLAPDTLGDGTGCDNMTAVIVQFKPLAQSEAEATSEAAPAPAKRGASPDSQLDAAKRARTDPAQSA